MVVVLHLAARVAFLPLGSSVVITSSPFPSPRSSEFLWEMAVWVLVEEVAVVSPTSMPLREVLVRPVAGGERETHEKKLLSTNNTPVVSEKVYLT